MTLNIIINNIVAVDSQVSMRMRTSNDATKIQEFSGDRYHGVLIGNGSGNNILQAEALVRNTEFPRFYDLSQAVEEQIKIRHASIRKNYEDRREKEIRTKYRTVDDPAARADLINREWQACMDELSRSFNQEQPQGGLYIVARDKDTGNIRKVYLPETSNTQSMNLDDHPVINDGSGGDLAGAYLTTQTSGIDWKKISLEHNTYLTGLACAAATGNTGVGGYMKIAIIAENGVEYLNDKTSTSVVRICSKQIAGDVGKKEALKLVAKVLSDKPEYGKVAKQLGITARDLLNTPADVHSDMATFNRNYQG
jgi:hypothetical protein